MSKRKPPFRNGKIYVMAEQCKTCIFRPGNKMSLQKGTVKEMVRKTRVSQSCIPCHTTTYNQDPRGEAVCNGFYTKFATMPLQLAAAMKKIEFQTEMENEQ